MCIAVQAIVLRWRKVHFRWATGRCGSDGDDQMIDNRLAPYGAFALRASLGVMFIAHAYLKLAVFTVPGFEGFLGKVGLPAFLAWPIILAELIGGVAILTGFYSRLVSIALLPVLLGALFVHASNGWVFNAPNGGWEYPAFLAVVAVAQALIGDGAFAVKSIQAPRLGAGQRVPSAA
jgi:putative oxidoreductase